MADPERLKTIEEQTPSQETRVEKPDDEEIFSEILEAEKQALLDLVSELKTVIESQPSSIEPISPKVDGLEEIKTALTKIQEEGQAVLKEREQKIQQVKTALAELGLKKLTVESDIKNYSEELYQISFLIKEIQQNGLRVQALQKAEERLLTDYRSTRLEDSKKPDLASINHQISDLETEYWKLGRSLLGRARNRARIRDLRMEIKKLREVSSDLETRQPTLFNSAFFGRDVQNLAVEGARITARKISGYYAKKTKPIETQSDKQEAAPILGQDSIDRFNEELFEKKVIPRLAEEGITDPREVAVVLDFLREAYQTKFQTDYWSTDEQVKAAIAELKQTQASMSYKERMVVGQFLSEGKTAENEKYAEMAAFVEQAPALRERRAVRSSANEVFNALDPILNDYPFWEARDGYAKSGSN